MATKKPAATSKAAKKSSPPSGALFMDLGRGDHDPFDYDIDSLARRTVLKHPAVQKRIDKVKARLSKTVNGHSGGISAMRAEESVPAPETGGAPKDTGKLKGPAQVVSTRMPRQDKLPKPKSKSAKASKTSY